MLRKRSGSRKYQHSFCIYIDNMEHRFNVQIAQKYGIEEAIIIGNLYYWIAKNVANEVHNHEGRYWTYNSAQAFAVLFPYMNEPKIYRVMANLEEKGIILKGNFNSNKYNHTKWYSFSDKGLGILQKQGYDTNGFADFLQNDEIDFTNLQNRVYKNAKSNTNSKPNNKQEKENTKVFPKKGDNDELFEQCWVAYKRKGVKKQARAQWVKLKDEEKQRVLRHIQSYVNTREVKYQKDFERYLRDKVFDEVVFQDNRVVFDPNKGNGETYNPEISRSLFYNDQEKCYMFIGYDYSIIPDGYTDDNRPNGAKVVLNNGRGTLTWIKEQKTWENDRN